MQERDDGLRGPSHGRVEEMLLQLEQLVTPIR